MTCFVRHKSSERSEVEWRRGDSNLPPENHNPLPADDLQKNQEAALPKNCQNDPDLALVVECWPDLPEHIKQAIKALIKAADTHRSH
jgi:hypothetical protein